MIDSLYQQLSNHGKSDLPPVEKWNPPLSGVMDLTIKRDGSWWHEGAEIKRFSLVKLFAGILKKEGDDYYLVSPVEKWRIHVEDVPFIILKVDIILAKDSLIQFETNVGDVFILDYHHPLEMMENTGNETIPYVLVRRNLYARLSRSVYYELVSMAEESIEKDEKHIFIRSAGTSFELGRVPI